MRALSTKNRKHRGTTKRQKKTAHSPVSLLQKKQQMDLQRILRQEEIQTKLSMGQPDDKYEQEADRVADHVLRMSNSDVAKKVNNHLIRPTSVQKMCANCEEELAQRQVEEDDEVVQKKLNNDRIQFKEGDKTEEEVQTKEVPGKSTNVGSRTESSINNLRGGGQPLEPATRNYFEPRFGRDFSKVRVHKDQNAADISRSINARAFTKGNDIAFGSGEYQPQSTEGKRLLGHELTHVVQQNGSNTLPLQRVMTCDGVTDCPGRVRGELSRSRSDPHGVRIYQPSRFGILIDNFAIDQASIKSGLHSNPLWRAAVTRFGSTDSGQIEVLGFSDCTGSASRNLSLRSERANAIAAILPTAASARVANTSAANPTECIASNLNESGRKKNRSVLIRRLPGSTGPTPPGRPAPIGPVRPPGSPGGFCVPFTGMTAGIEAAAARTLVEQVWLRYANSTFGPDVHALWRDYLNRPKGASLRPRVFRGAGNRIVDAFRTDPDTRREARLLLNDIRTAVAVTPEANVPFTGNRYRSPPIGLGTLLPAARLRRIINYGNPSVQIPGNIAGGTGASDAGPDLRLFTGEVRILRTHTGSSGPEIKRAEVRLQLQVVDAIDFCPGAAGGLVAQQITIPMSRLEATPAQNTYDLPFHVFVDLSATIPVP